MALIVGTAESLQFEVVAIAEQRLPLARQRKRIGLAPGQDGAAHIALGGAGERDQAGAWWSASSQARSSSGTPRSWPSSQARVIRLATFW